MATRLSLYSDTSTLISPAFDSLWDKTTDAIRCRMLPGVVVPAIAAYTVAGINSDTFDTLFAQQQYGPIKKQTISGTVKGQLLVRQEAAGVNARAQVVLKVVTAAGALRGVLYAGTAGGLSSEFATSFENRKFPLASASPITLTPVDAENGDFVIFEQGFREHSPTSAAGARVGTGSTSGLTHAPEDETTTTSGTNILPWIEFSHNIELGAVGEETGAGTDAFVVQQPADLTAETGAGTDDFVVQQPIALDAETGAGTDDLTVSTTEGVALTGETGAGTDSFAVEIETSLSTGRLWVGRFIEAAPAYTVENEILAQEQIEEAQLRPNVVSVDGNTDTWIEYDRADLTSRDTVVNAHYDLPELNSSGDVRQRAVEELESSRRNSSPGGPVPWDPRYTRLDKIFWITRDGSKYETRIEGLAVEFNQGKEPYQRANIDTGLMVYCPPDEEGTYLVRDLFEREEDDGLGEALTGGTWVTYNT